MYTSRTPKNNEIVFVQLKNSTCDLGNYVELTDYNLDGLVLCTEIGKYKSNLKNTVKKDEIFPVLVMNINETSEQKNIDLSYVKVKYDRKDLLKNCYIYQNRFVKLTEKIFNENNIESVYFQNFIGKYISPENYLESVASNRNISKEKYDTFLKNPEEFVDFFGDNKKNNEIVEKIKKSVKSKISVRPFESQQDFKLCIFDNNSLDKLKEILNKIKNIGDTEDTEDTEDKEDTEYINNFEIVCKSSPIYQIKIKGNNLDSLKQSYENIKNKICEIIGEYDCVLEFCSDYVITKTMEIDMI